VRFGTWSHYRLRNHPAPASTFALSSSVPGHSDHRRYVWENQQQGGNSIAGFAIGHPGRETRRRSARTRNGPSGTAIALVGAESSSGRQEPVCLTCYWRVHRPKSSEPIAPRGRIPALFIHVSDRQNLRMDRRKRLAGPSAWRGRYRNQTVRMLSQAEPTFAAFHIRDEPDLLTRATTPGLPEQLPSTLADIAATTLPEQLWSHWSVQWPYPGWRHAVEVQCRSRRVRFQYCRAG
jgi:hypothetical protein